MDKLTQLLILVKILVKIHVKILVKILVNTLLFLHLVYGQTISKRKVRSLLE